MEEEERQELGADRGGREGEREAGVKMDKKQGLVKKSKETKCIMEENVTLASVSVSASVGCVRELLLLASFSLLCYFPLHRWLLF